MVVVAAVYRYDTTAEVASSVAGVSGNIDSIFNIYRLNETLLWNFMYLFVCRICSYLFYVRW